ncbi:hypothetical protein [Nocardia sp. bgisy134]|uniref:hypothetical protein n=1 Tax=Nocardia sp. bgisy134 TaxID=3413789 RepID=UPI003D751E84
MEVEIASGATQSGFELVFRLSRGSPLHTVFLLSDGAPLPVVRVVVVASFGGISQVLIDGVTTRHEFRDARPEPNLVIMGKDLSALMDLIPFDGLPYPAMPIFARVNLALLKYAAFGIVPVVIPPVIEDIPLPIERIPLHHGTDLQYIKLLAESTGYVFYLEPGPTVGTSRAYFGPEVRVGAPQPALDLDLDLPHRNVESLSFRFDKEDKEIPLVYLQEQFSKAVLSVPIPDVSPLTPPLGLIPPLPPKIVPLRDTAKHKPWVALLHGLAYAAEHGDAVVGDGSLDVARYGRILQSRRLVGVRGAGGAFDGLYYVTRVTHTLERGEYKQSFSLARNGLVSTVEKVPV